VAVSGIVWKFIFDLVTHLVHGVILTDRLLSFYFFILRVIYSICYDCLKTKFSDRCSADQVMVILAVGFTTFF
jgi:hypothetical protein